MNVKSANVRLKKNESSLKIDTLHLGMLTRQVEDDLAEIFSLDSKTKMYQQYNEWYLDIAI